MTTRREIKALIAPLLARNDDLAFVDGVVVLKPVHHIVRTIIVDRTRNPKLCNIVWAVQSLVGKFNMLTLGGGETLYRKGPDPLWFLTDPSLPQELVEIAESEALPKMRAIPTLEAYIARALAMPDKGIADNRPARFIFNIALGRLDEAREEMRHAPDAPIVASFNQFEPGLGDRLMSQGSALSNTDRAALARSLHERVAYSVDKLKLASVWEKTPFPLELSAG